MNNSIVDKISEYFDEGLSGNNEEILFKELSASPELRKIFQEHLQMLSGFSSDISRLTPPIESTEKIFSALGFSIPSSGAVEQPIAKSRVQRKLSKLTLSLLLLFFASCISLLTLVVSGIFSEDNLFSENTSKNKNIHKDSSNRATNNYSSSSTDAFSASAATAAATNNNNKKNNNNYYEKTFPHDYNKTLESTTTNNINSNINSNNTSNLLYSNNSSNEKYSNSNIIIDKEIDKIINDLFTQNTILDYESHENIKNIFAENSILTPNNKRPSLTEIDKKQSATISKKAKFMLAINKSILGTAPPTNITRNDIIWNNATLIFNYRLDNSNFIGIEIGWQDFPQEFTRTINQNIFEQKQMPVLFYGGASYSYNLSPLFNLETMEPFSQFSIGGTSIGPVFGAALGTYINIYKNFGLNLTGNFNILLYNVEDKIYTSDKFGLKIGLFYGF